MSEHAKGSGEHAFWIGYSDREGNTGPFVFDPQLQRADDKYVGLYDADQNLFRRYERAQLRSWILPVRAESQRAQALQALIEWKCGDEGRELQRAIEETNTDFQARSERAAAVRARRQAASKRLKQVQAEQKQADDLIQVETLARLGSGFRTVIIRHRKQIDGSLEEYKGIALAMANNRFTHCFSCKEPLEGHGGLICLTCKGIVCHCGACPCTWYPRGWR